MGFSARLQLLTCLMVYASSAHAIMVKYGTKDGPIVPPAPEPSPSPQPYRDPAPVWEERSNDTPDPNAQWRPPFFIPQPRHTHVVYNPIVNTPLPINNAQRFVNAYIPAHKPVRAESQGISTILSSQTLPGVGLRYFYPVFNQEEPQTVKQDDAKLNHIDAPVETQQDASSDFQWKYEKDATRRIIKDNQEDGTVAAPSYPVYQFPAYVPRHH